MIWSENIDPRLPLYTTEGVLHSASRAGLALSCTADTEQIRALVTAYQSFIGDRSPIETALSRLATAWGNREREARAIDLGIALEVILMFESHNEIREPSTEIRYKIGTRAAWLVENTFKSRKSVFQAVRRLYDLRSQAAHLGTCRYKSTEWMKVDAELESGLKFAARLIKELLLRGKWPNWNDLVLGGL